MKLKLRTFRVGTPRKAGEGIRIGTVRFTPRGVRKEDYARLNLFDVWFPTVAPSPSLVKWAMQLSRRNAFGEKAWKKFAARYEREMISQTDSRQSLILLAKLATRIPLSIGCYCEDESKCHRSLLKLLIGRAARNQV
jgi:uncharacterized protein YeaO (DUF488 family)